MWRTQDGILHTVALPSSSVLFTDESLTSIREVLNEMNEQVRAEFIEALADEAIEASAKDFFDFEEERRWEAATPPQEILSAVVTDDAELFSAVSRLPVRWRLDVALAIDDVAEQL